MYGYSASLAAMIMSMKTMSYEMNKRQDGILVFAVVTDSPHTPPEKTAGGEKMYDVTVTRDRISKVVHSAGEAAHGKCL